MIIQPKNWRWWVALLPALAVEALGVSAYMAAASLKWVDIRLDNLAIAIGRWAFRN